MSKRIANQEVKEALMIGYDHYSRKYEKTFFEELLKGEIVDRKNYEKPEQFPLADNNIRNIKTAWSAVSLSFVGLPPISVLTIISAMLFQITISTKLSAKRTHVTGKPF